MSDTGKIYVDFDDLAGHYPTYNKLPKELKDFMTGLGPGNTPCCVQVSHALNKVGPRIPSQGYRRRNSPIGSDFYILAVDELEVYLTWRFGKGEEIKHQKRTLAQMKQYLNGKQGILLFRDTGAGYHTELWDTDHILQDGNARSSNGAVMNQENIFSKPRVLFWEVVGEDSYMVPNPAWLRGWWEVYDGHYYYYYFSDQDIVTYVKSKPKSTTAPPVSNPLNSGEVEIADDESMIIINWNPSDGGETVETFSRRSSTFMNGTSNRYSPLTATKMK
jgi:hypothetical protein